MDWKQSVLSAVREVMNHPKGGRIEIHVNVTDKPGERIVQVHPLMYGMTRSRVVFQIDDD